MMSSTKDPAMSSGVFSFFFAFFCFLLTVGLFLGTGFVVFVGTRQSYIYQLKECERLSEVCR